MGHEFSARVIEPGAGVALRPGDVVTSMPVMLSGSGFASIGYSNEFNGGYAERMLLSAALCLKVPNGLDPRHAALTEPMAVGLHAVAKSGIAKGDAALVMGCGPVGLAVISALKLAGIDPIVAADFSPARRTLATRLGAHEVVDPKQEPGIDAWKRVDGTRPLVIFEAVGVPGMLDRAMRDAPRLTRILVVGVCMETDSIWPMLGINKELTLQFVLGYTPEEFSRTLTSIAAGDIDVAPLITGEVGIAGVRARSRRWGTLTRTRKSSWCRRSGEQHLKEVVQCYRVGTRTIARSSQVCRKAARRKLPLHSGCGVKPPRGLLPFHGALSMLVE